jgi:hypothetical protein
MFGDICNKPLVNNNKTIKSIRLWQVQDMKRNLIHYQGLLLLITGVVMMVMGIYRGEVTVVFSKAINICLECIGIG